MEEKNLLNRLQNNEQMAINETYQRNWIPCTSFVRKNNGSDQHAEDMYQDTWMVLLRNLDKGIKLKNENAAGVDAYLRGINKNLWLGYIRKRAKADYE
ncbi:MAG: RNA polymerase sigma factor [Saprospiraceae bacterium]